MLGEDGVLISAHRDMQEYMIYISIFVLLKDILVKKHEWLKIFLLYHWLPRLYMNKSSLDILLVLLQSVTSTHETRFMNLLEHGNPVS